MLRLRTRQERKNDKGLIMKILKKIRLNVFVALVAAFVLMLSMLVGMPIVSGSADGDEMPETIEYIDTNVSGIECNQHPTCVFFGFRLTESDYDDYGKFQGDFGELNNTDQHEVYKTYERYIALWLDYWKNFPSMNSEGVKFDQLYAYWNGGEDDCVGAWFTNTVTHRSTLKRLEYGFVISIPAGTTFPSAKYVKGNCEGNPIMYRTTEDKAFYYNGTSFEEMPYAIAMERTAAETELNSVNIYSYYEAEREMVTALIEQAKTDIKLCFTSLTIQERKTAFYEELSKIMTKADYAQLDLDKETAKTELSAYFDGLSEAVYGAEGWQEILAIEEQAYTIIDGLKAFDEIDSAVLSVKFAVSKVATAEERAQLQQYLTSASERIGAAFNAALYREAERALGAQLVTDGQAALLLASSKDEVDSISADYIARIMALTTDAQWIVIEQQAANNNNNENDDQDGATDSNTNDPIIIENDDTIVVEREEKGCGSVVGGMGIIFGVMAMAASVTIKNKVGKENEN